MVWVRGDRIAWGVRESSKWFQVVDWKIAEA